MSQITEKKFPRAMLLGGLRVNLNHLKRKRSADNRLERVQSEGGTYLVPVSDRLNKINNYRKFEQGFRVYANIYCGANPMRSREIWQYVSVISTAASSFLWENVYKYNVTFRHLMAFNPARSWAVTYGQMWNICMKDPIPQRTGQFYSNNDGKAMPSATGGGGGGKKKEPDYCWNWNKGIPCKYGKKCHFVERCSYCDAATHGVNQCPKLIDGNNKKDKD